LYTDKEYDIIILIMMDMNIKLSPEVVIMLPFGIMCDIIGLIFLLFGLDDCGLADIVPIMIIFPWLLLRGKPLPNLEGGAEQRMMNLFTDKRFRFLTPLIGELTPYLGGIGFFWTLTVLLNVVEREEEELEEAT
jgi:hypothetical protein